MSNKSSETLNASQKLEFKAHLEHFGQLETVEEAEFTPPPDATLVPRKIYVSSAVAQGNLIKQTPLKYPADAQAARIQGMVTLKITIGKDGLLTNVHAIAGPSELQAAAEESVRGWVYRPYLLNGQTVSVDTQVNVVFKLGR